ncbi:unnamed protein product [Amaranthus hypochondriacus]
MASVGNNSQKILRALKSVSNPSFHNNNSTFLGKEVISESFLPENQELQNTQDYKSKEEDEPPVTPQSSPIKEKVEAVVQLLDNVEIVSKHDGDQSELQERRGVTLDKKSNQDQQVDDNTYDEGNTAMVIRADSQPRKWRRRQKGDSGSENRSSVSVPLKGSFKRPNDSDFLLYSSDFNNEANKKRAVPMEVENENLDVKVVSPTRRALGDQ